MVWKRFTMLPGKQEVHIFYTFRIFVVAAYKKRYDFVTSKHYFEQKRNKGREKFKIMGRKSQR